MTAHVANYSMNVDDIFSPVYVAVATGAATCQTNTDPRGGTWTSRTMPTSTAWASVDYGNGIIAALSSTSGTIAATSVDGTTWIQRVLPTSTTWSAIKYGHSTNNPFFVAVSSAGNYAATSPDGATWTARSITGTSYAWKSLAYGGGIWVALANAAESNTLRTAVSADGITWSNNNTTSITCPGTWSSIFYGNGRFVAVCSGSSVAAYSTDGINWTETALPVSTAWIGVTYGENVWIAVTATNSDKAARSTDNGATWSEITFPAASTWRAVIYGKNLVNEGVFAGIGATTVGNYSIDGGVTWNAKTQITMTYTAACYAPITWFSNDSLTINNQAVIDVNTEQKKFWSTMSIANGRLNITNTSTTNGITFAMGRASGAVAGTITPASGLGSINIQGDFINLGSGSGSAGQTVTAPFTDYIPAVWVETASGSGVYEQWINATGAYGDSNSVMKEGLAAVGKGNRGKFFVQTAATAPYGPINLTTTTATFENQRGTRYLVVDSTTGVIAGAQVFGAGIPAATVVNRVLSSTELELNLPITYKVRTDWKAIAYGGSGGTTYVALSQNYSDICATSTDNGVTWTKRSMPFKAEWSAICWGATSGRFVAVCRNSNLCATSPDGITWTIQYLPATQNWNAVASNGTSFVAVGATTADAVTTIGASSVDGQTWVATTMTSGIWRCCAYGSGRYVALAQTGVLNYDTDGIGTWTNGTALTSATYVGIAWNGSRFVAISGSSTATRYSADGISWSSGGNLPNSTFTCLCWTGTTYIALSTSTTLAQTGATSTDGASWTNRSVGVNQWSAVCYGAAAVALAGSNATNFAGSVCYTSDATGVTWANQAGIVSDVAITCFNPYKAQLTSTLTFGDGTNGTLIPTNANILCPNIMVTSLTPANLHTASSALGCSFVLTNGGIVTIDTALFDECYHNFTQAQSLTITDAAFSIPFVVSECYKFTLNRVVFALQPVRRYFTLPYWYSRELRYGQTSAWNYINDAVVNDLQVCVGSTHAQYGTTTAISPITLSYTDGATFNRYKIFATNPIKANQTGILSSTMTSNCTFNDCFFYGTNICTITTSNNNLFSKLTVAPSLYSGKMGMGTSATRIGIDPATGASLVDNTKYYFKVRSYRDWTDLTNYVEGPLVSATPFLGSRWFSPRFSAVNTASGTVTFNWDRRDPVAGSVAAYEIFRGTTEGFTRNLAARIYTTTTGTTITTTDATAINGNTYYYVLRKYDGVLTGITNSSGTTGQYILGTSQNFLTGLGSIANCAGTTGTRKVTIPSGSASNFVVGNVWVGMPIAGGGLAAGTTVTSIDNELEITISQDITTTFVSQTLTLGAVAGLYVSGTGIVAGTRIVSVDSATQITVDTAFSGTVSGTISFLYGTEGPEVRVYVAGAKQTASNYLFQSYDFTNSSWVKTNITTTAATFFPPEQVYFNSATAPTALGVRLWSIGPSANMVNTQTGLTSATSYCFSMYVMTPQSLQLNNVVSCTIAINTTVPTTTTFNANGKWQRISLPFTSTATSHTFTFTINTNGAQVYASCAQINLGSSATQPVTTTTAAVTLNPIVQEITAAYAWGRSTAGDTANQGIEIVLATAPAGTHYTNVYMSTDPAFTPATDNLVDTTIPATWAMCQINTSSGVTVENIIQEEKGQAGTLFGLAGSSNNTFKDITYDFGYGVSALLNISNLANANLFHNFTISKFRNFIATSGFTTLNNSSDNVIQNMYFDTFDLPILVNSLNTTFRGISGGNASPAGSATTWVMGGTSDGIGVANVTVYDTIFYEMYHSPTTGALNLIFNDSTKAVKPYSILSGTPSFSNTGKLYLQTVGDSIEFTWPKAIKGVSSFRNIQPKFNGLDLGTAPDRLFGLNVQFAVDDGYTGTYGDWNPLTGPNLAATTITDNKVGFGLKIKITCKTGMKYTAQTNSFVINEQIRGVTSLATAYVREDNDLGTTGDIILDTVVGTFIAGEAIVKHSDGATRATNLATNTNFALFPSFTSYIDGLQIYTNVDPTVLYEPYTDPVTITVVNSSLTPVEGAIVRIVATETVEGITTGDLLLQGLTNASGVLSGNIDSFEDVEVLIRIRQGSVAPYYKASDVPNTFITGEGLSATIVVIGD